MHRVKEKIITGDEFDHLRSQIVTSNDNLNLKLQNATIDGRRGHHRKYLPYAFTPKQWIEKTNAIGIVFKAGRYVGTCGIAKCGTFKAASGQQAVAQLTQILLGQNITKNLLDEFRSSLPSIEEIEAESSGVEESQ